MLFFSAELIATLTNAACFYDASKNFAPIYPAKYIFCVFLASLCNTLSLFASN